MNFNHPLHPLTVHFPIVFYLLGLALTMLYLWRGQTDYERLAYYCFMLSGVAAIVSALVGLIDQNQLPLADPRRDAVNSHITAGIALIISNAILLYMRFRWPDVLTRYRAIYLGVMLIGGLLVLTTAWLGGELVYTLGVGVK
ncbi:DUF2231 domain-containing protein [Anaerolineales bacterium HSG6]|nr:DUF2231 domain-containing protein [Anaerolineales bacterium HSG6]